MKRNFIFWPLSFKKYSSPCRTLASLTLPVAFISPETGCRVIEQYARLPLGRQIYLPWKQTTDFITCSFGSVKAANSFGQHCCVLQIAPCHRGLSTCLSPRNARPQSPPSWRLSDRSGPNQEKCEITTKPAFPVLQMVSCQEGSAQTLIARLMREAGKMGRCVLWCGQIVT